MVPSDRVWFVYMETIPLGAFPADSGRADHFFKEIKLLMSFGHPVPDWLGLFALD